MVQLICMLRRSKDSGTGLEHLWGRMSDRNAGLHRAAAPHPHALLTTHWELVSLKPCMWKKKKNFSHDSSEFQWCPVYHLAPQCYHMEIYMLVSALLYYNHQVYLHINTEPNHRLTLLIINIVIQVYDEFLTSSGSVCILKLLVGRNVLQPSEGGANATISRLQTSTKQKQKKKKRMTLPTVFKQAL